MYSYLHTVPALVRYLARLVVTSPHDQLRVQLQVDAVFTALQSFLVHAALTEDRSNLATVLWALRRSNHLTQIVALKTDAQCSPLVPHDVVELYSDVLDAIEDAARDSSAFRTYFGRHLDKFTTANLGSSDPVALVKMLQEDLGVLKRLFWMVPWQLSARRRERAASRKCPIQPMSTSVDN